MAKDISPSLTEWGERVIASGPLSRAALLRLRYSSSGSTAVEYGLIASLVAIGIVGAIIGYEEKLLSILGTVSNAVENYN